MKRQTVVLLAAVVVVAAGGTVPVAAQQSDSNPNLVWNSTTIGAVNSRSPGRMVDAGIARYSEVRGNAFDRPNITEQAEDPDLITQVKINVIQTLFQQLNTILLGLNNVIRAEGGLGPYVPTPITPGNVGSLP